jgi:hypothetical protein
MPVIDVRFSSRLGSSAFRALMTAGVNVTRGLARVSCPPVGQAVAAGAHLRDNSRQLKNIGLPVEPADGLGVRRVQWG